MWTVALRSAFGFAVLYYIYRVARGLIFHRRGAQLLDTLRALQTINQIPTLEACELFGAVINRVGSHEEPLHEMLHRALISALLRMRLRKDDPISVLRSSIAGVQFIAFASTQTDLDQGASLVCSLLKNTVRNNNLEIATQDIKNVLASIQNYVEETETSQEFVRTSFALGFVNFRYWQGRGDVEGRGTLRKFYISVPLEAVVQR